MNSWTSFLACLLLMSYVGPVSSQMASIERGAVNGVDSSLIPVFAVIVDLGLASGEGDDFFSKFEAVSNA